MNIQVGVLFWYLHVLRLIEEGSHLKCQTANLISGVDGNK